MNDFKPIICMDFDGVLHQYLSKWISPEVIPDPPVPGAVEAVTAYLRAGFRVAVFSSRSATVAGRQAMERWCYSNGFPSDDMDFPAEKPPAILTIDDRGFCFCGVFPEPEFIRNFRPWNR